MKLLRVGAPGAERPAALLPDGSLVDISELVPDIVPQTLHPEMLRPLAQRLEERGPELPRLEHGNLRIAAPVHGVGKIVCVGLNYREHAREAGLPVPSEPILFLKAGDTVVGPNDTVRIPRGSEKTDYEVELGVVIGVQTRYLDSPAQALSHVAGFVVSNDVSEREFQMERGGQWDKGKNCETFSPLGPWLVTADEVPDPQDLRLHLRVNGELRQDSTTADMIFGVEHLIWYISQFMVLRPGDIINTGTPPGVGSGFTPPRFVRDGDVVELGIDGLGGQCHAFRGYVVSRADDAARLPQPEPAGGLA
ncbi:fumarylacetoacetate hydrolase family protein [Terrabacter terrigena]|uniref:Fumarylacetoacetate hydrolase family protein n=1 Tax=Terrabacter terrigena TaxID=574718 RepID=A0ABW3MWE4_9MICO